MPEGRGREPPHLPLSLCSLSRRGCCGSPGAAARGARTPHSPLPSGQGADRLQELPVPPLAILLPHGTRGHRPGLAERGHGDGPAPAPMCSPVPPRHRPAESRTRHPQPGHAVLRCAHPGQESARSPADSGGGRPESPSRSFRPRSPPHCTLCPESMEYVQEKLCLGGIFSPPQFASRAAACWAEEKSFTSGG